jgi:2,6-dihydroxypyridine 3-monooxygenase
MYTIPGELEVGKRLLNYVRYRNVADGPELDELTEIAATNGTQTVLG